MSMDSLDHVIEDIASPDQVAEWDWPRIQKETGELRERAEKAETDCAALRKVLEELRNLVSLGAYSICHEATIKADEALLSTTLGVDLLTQLHKAEATIDTMLRCVGKNAGNVDDPVAAIKAIYRSLVDAREQAEKAQVELQDLRALRADIAKRLDITEDSEILLLLDVRLRRYEHDVNVDAATKLRQEKQDLRERLRKAEEAVIDWREQERILRERVIIAEEAVCGNAKLLARVMELEKGQAVQRNRALDLMERYRTDGSCESDILDIMTDNLVRITELESKGSELKHGRDAAYAQVIRLHDRIAALEADLEAEKVKSGALKLALGSARIGEENSGGRIAELEAALADARKAFRPWVENGCDCVRCSKGKAAYEAIGRLLEDNG